jgi:hypothetical protein
MKQYLKFFADVYNRLKKMLMNCQLKFNTLSQRLVLIHYESLQWSDKWLWKRMERILMAEEKNPRRIL